VLLPETDLGGACAIAARIAGALAALAIPHGQSPVSPHITASMGVAALIPEPEQRCADLLAAADGAVYAAKAAGRNKIMTA